MQSELDADDADEESCRVQSVDSKEEVGAKPPVRVGVGSLRRVLMDATFVYCETSNTAMYSNPFASQLGISRQTQC
jgi:hypothetical protein